MEGLSNIFINNTLFPLDRFFRGVYSANEISSIMLKPQESIIVNLSYSFEPGTHFIAFYRKENSLIYFDSLCMYFLDSNLKAFILKHNLKFEYNKLPIQHIKSSFCGYYCIFFILYIKYNSIINYVSIFFTTNKLLLFNDYLVLKYISTMIK
jgi:hypothetical protein